MSIPITKSSNPIQKSSRIGIIGAGPAGISAAHFLKKEGYTNVIILESDSHIAGKSSTCYVDGRGFDVGALMVGNNYKNIKSLAKELNCQMDKFTGRALNIDVDNNKNQIMVDDTDKICIYSHLLPHTNHYLKERSAYEKISLPGHGNLSENNLYAPISQWLKDTKMEYLKDAWSLAYTSAGYGYIQDDIPAAYFLKFIENSENNIWYFKNGFQDFWAKMAKDINISCNSKVKTIDRSLKRKNSGPILVTVENTIYGSEQTYAFDHLIIATNPKQTTKFLDVSLEETNIFSEIITYDFYTTIATVEGISTKVGMTTIPKHCTNNSQIGHVTAFYCAHEGVPTYLFYAYGKQGIASDDIIGYLKDDIEKIGGKLNKIHYHKKWDFFPHVSSLSMARGFYSKVERMQGTDETFYVGGWLDFELTENCVAYSKDLVKRFFNLSFSQNPEQISSHLPIRQQITLKPVSQANWGMVLRLAANRYPKKVAYTWVDVNLREEAKFTYGQLYQQARAVAYYLRNVAECKVGDPILLCYAPGLSFLPVLLGSMLAGTIAVPIAPPDLEKDIERFIYLANITKAKYVFSDKNYMLYTKIHSVKNFFGFGKKVTWPESLIWLEGEKIIAASSNNLFDENLIDKIDSNNVAVLQFSSGSTGDPKGVMLTHKNLLHNVDLMQNEIGLDHNSTIAFWVPYMHDLGLIGGFLNTLRGSCKSVAMSPLSFLQKPESWLQMITKYKANYTAAPNFAYELAARKCSDSVLRQLDLSTLKGAFNGAEPVRSSTLKAFTKKFESVGFKATMFKCLYGLAEHCAYTVGFQNKQGFPTVIDIDPIAVREDRVIINHRDRNNSDGRHHYLVSTGLPNLSMQIEIRIVDPETKQLCSPNVIGEVWVSSPSVGIGYYGRPDLSDEIFRAKLNLNDHGNLVSDKGSFLRTGDLGFMYDGELFIAGRQKDVIIINGKNHHPQDIELSVQQSHKSIRPGCVAALAVNNDEKTGTDSLIILAEVREDSKPTKMELEEICDTISRIIPGKHGISCQSVTLLKQRSLPKTTSGKLQRSKAKDMLTQGLLDSKILETLTIENKIISQVHKVSRVASKSPIKEIDTKSNLIQTYAFDSITAVQLVSCLKEEFGIEMSPALILDLPTISELAEHISKQLSATANYPKQPQIIKLSKVQSSLIDQIRKISRLAAKIPIEMIDIQANIITDFGLDSLAALQLISTIKETFGVEIIPTLLFDVNTIEGLSNHVYEAIVAKQKSQIKSLSSSPTTATFDIDRLELEKYASEVLVPLAPKNIINKHNNPLFCIHALLGNVACYMHFAKNVGMTRPVYGIQVSTKDIDDTNTDICSMVEKYVKVITYSQPKGPYHICGYSFGGLVAWEIAKQLINQGKKVGGVYLIDAPAPLKKLVRPTVNAKEVTKNNLIWEKDIEQLLKDVDLNNNNDDDIDDAQTKELKQTICKLIALMYNYTDDISSNNINIPVHYWRAREYNGKTNSLLLDHPEFHSTYFGWENYNKNNNSKNITFHEPLPGHHFSIMKVDNSGRLAREMDKIIPAIKRRTGSLDLKPLMLEKLANARRLSSDDGESNYGSSGEEIPYNTNGFTVNNGSDNSTNNIITKCICDFRINFDGCQDEEYILRLSQWILIIYSTIIILIAIGFLSHKIIIRKQAFFLPPTKGRGIIRPIPHDVVHVLTIVFNLFLLIHTLILLNDAYPNTVSAEIGSDLSKELGIGLAMIYPISIIYSTPVLGLEKKGILSCKPNKNLIDALGFLLLIAPLTTLLPLAALTGHYADQNDLEMAMMFHRSHYFIWVVWGLVFLILIALSWFKLTSTVLKNIKESRKKEINGYISDVQCTSSTPKKAARNLGVAIVLLIAVLLTYLAILLSYSLSRKSNTQFNPTINLFFMFALNFTLPFTLNMTQFVFIFSTLRGYPFTHSTDLSHELNVSNNNKGNDESIKNSFRVDD
nr:15096_t:CDS:10 [Entrophospora candida]